MPELLIDNRKAWLAARADKITSTRIAGIAGFSRYATPLSVYEDMKGLAPDMEENNLMWNGIMFEEAIAKMFAVKMSELSPPERADFIVHPEIPFFATTPDYYVGDDAVLEIKTSFSYNCLNFGEEWTDQVPQEYVVQCQWHLGITGRSVCYLAVLLGIGGLKIYVIDRNEEMIKGLFDLGIEFKHSYIDDDSPPPISGHEVDKEILDRHHPDGADVSIRAGDDFEFVLQEFEIAHEDVKEAEKRLDECKNKVREYIGDNNTLMSNLGKFTWKNSADRITTAWAKVFEELEAAKSISKKFLRQTVSKHTTTKPGPRVLRTPFKESK